MLPVVGIFIFCISCWIYLNNIVSTNKKDSQPDPSITATTTTTTTSGQVLPSTSSSLSSSKKTMSTSLAKTNQHHYQTTRIRKPSVNSLYLFEAQKRRHDDKLSTNIQHHPPQQTLPSHHHRHINHCEVTNDTNDISNTITSNSTMIDPCILANTIDETTHTDVSDPHWDGYTVLTRIYQFFLTQNTIPDQTLPNHINTMNFFLTKN